MSALYRGGGGGGGGGRELKFAMDINPMFITTDSMPMIL